nr:uncharacterized protein LOC128702729 [Cherax quadricarinatus]
MALISKEYNLFRFIKALNECGRGVLHYIFCLGTPDKPATMKLDDYLKTLKQTSSANYLKLSRSQKRFNKTQKKLIENSADGTGFDIPLLCLSIKLAAENVAQFDDPKWMTPSAEMEYYITAIKNMRNDALHGPLAVPDEDYNNNMKEFREMLTGCLKTSGERYGQDEAEVNDKIKQINNDLDYIMDEILGEEDIVKYCKDDLKQIIINDSRDKLKNVLEKVTYISPVSSIINNFQVKVDKIFVDIEVKQGKRGGNNEHIDYGDLLTLVKSGTQQHGSSARPQILLLEGVAGSGKTTLVKLVTEEWIQGGQGNIKGLDNYDLLLWVQCRDPTINSFQDLLDRLIPDVSTKFRNVLHKIIKLCNILILVDGLDEFNDNSRKLVSSLLFEFQNSVNTAYMCTSRPETVEMFSLTIPEDYNVTNAELRGVNNEHMETFVRRTHQEITKVTNSNRDTNKLVNKVMKIKDLHEHLRLPMNLTFFVYICDQEPDETEITTITQTELYDKIHHMWQSKLLERLATRSKPDVFNESIVINSVQEILKTIYAISLESLSRDQLSLEEETVEQIISTCNKHNIPYDEILSAFFSLKPISTWQGIEERYSPPHKAIQDYFSALHIVVTLNYQLQSSTPPVSYTQQPTPPVSSQPSVTTVSPSRTSNAPALTTPAQISQTPTTQASFTSSPTSASPTPASLNPASPTQSSHTPGSPTPASLALCTLKASPASIREVLEESIKTTRLDMKKYRNVLVHVAGLLNLIRKQVSDSHAREVVHLLRESGIEDNDDWLDLLESNKVSPETIKEIVSFFSTEETMYVRDEHVRSYSAVLPYLRSCEVNIEIYGDPDDLPCLPDVLAALTNHHCTQLKLWEQWSGAAETTTTSDSLLQHVHSLSHLEVFAGYVTAGTVSVLPPILTELHLAVVSDNQALDLLPQLSASVSSTLHKLEYLGMKVSVAVSPASLMPLPNIDEVVLELTGVNDTTLSHACDMVQKLQPKER